jgi:hypothetical protein
MNSDQNTRTNRDQEVASRKSGISPTTQAATEQAAARNPATSSNPSPASHREYDVAERGKAVTSNRPSKDLPDNQEGLGP